VEARWDGAPEQGLFMKKGGRGFPYCVIMNPEGKVVWEVRPSDADRWAKGVENARKVVALQEASKKNPADQAAKANLALLSALGCQQRDPGPLGKLEAQAKVAGVDKKLLDRFNSWLPNKKFDAAFMKAVKGASRSEVGSRLLALYKKGVLPPKGNRYAGNLYYYAASAAIDANDLETARKAVAEFEKAVAANPRAKRAVDALKNKLAKAEGGGEEGDDP
jgi:hypothetical protein